MSGDKNFNNDTVEEILYRIYQKKNFQIDIERIRKSHGIPTGGFINENLAGYYWVNGPKLLKIERKDIDGLLEEYKENDLDSDLQQIIIKYKLPLGATPLIEMYVLTNNRFSLLPKMPDFYNCDFEGNEMVRIDSSTPIEKDWIKSGKRFVRIYIDEDTSLPRVKKYLDRHWKYIRENIFEKTKGKKFVRRGKNNQRNSLIFNLYNKLMPSEIMRQSRDILVSKQMKNDYSIDIEPENVRKIVQRMRELRDK
jgi:hypothetical protein